LAIFFIPVAVGIMGSFLEKVAHAIIRHHREKFARQLHDKPLTMEHIRMLDVDGDGEVTRAEFLEFMLVAMNEVDKGLLDRLKENFQRLDVDGNGTITKADLAEIAKRRMAENFIQQAKMHSPQYKQDKAQPAFNGSPAIGANLPKPTLDRGATQQTSNRTGISSISANSTSYQQQGHVV
jgi:EF hand